MAGIGDGWDLEDDDEWESYLTGRTDVVPGAEETRVKREPRQIYEAGQSRGNGVRFRGATASEVRNSREQEEESNTYGTYGEGRYETYRSEYDRRTRSEPQRGSRPSSFREESRQDPTTSIEGRNLYQDRRFRSDVDPDVGDQADSARKSNPRSRKPDTNDDRSDEYYREQQQEIQALRRQLTLVIQAQTNPVDKIFLESLAPMEYDGSGDFDEYLNQFEGTSQFLSWSENKRAASLFGRLKGRALTCVSSCPDRSYGNMIKRLRDRFSPIDEEMYHQRLTTYRKKADETWEDLAEKIETLALKAYRGMEERFRESMSAKAFCEAVVEPGIRRRLRQKHPKTLNEAVRVARMLDADLMKEEQWQEYNRSEKAKAGEKKSEKTRVVEEEQINTAQVQPETQKSGNQRGKAGPDKRKFKKSGKTITCYFCKMVGHIQRNCPFKIMMGGGTTFTMPQGFPQFQMPALPGITAPEQAPVTQTTTPQENLRGQNQPAALANLPKKSQ